ncbi:general secretion pathway protein G (plasmid) [Pararobbsia alpina]|uniref:type II secretion system protein n=1 Tax=Pararobbsia alpina TaxID=621374 RepID=UPI0039A6A715
MRHASIPSGSGFTLIELVVTLAVLGVLASAVLPVAQIQIQRRRESELRADLREIRSAIDAYKVAGDSGRFLRPAQGTGYPPTLQVLVDGVEDAHDPQKGKIFFLRRIPRDPMNSDPRVGDEESWQERSYASEPDSPEAGDDVYDVMSKSSRIGLNGIPYSRW